MRNKKICRFILLILLFSFLTNQCIATDTTEYSESFQDAFSEQNYRYVINNDGDKTCTIVEYTGNIYTNIIPATLNEYTVTRIGDGAFRYNSYFSGDISLPDTVISIGREAFYCCSNLTQVKVSRNLKEIGDKAFYKCDSLTKINLGSVETIGNEVFKECKFLRTRNIVIPDTVKSLGNEVFTSTNIKSIEFTSSVAPTITQDTFSGYTGELVVPDTDSYKVQPWLSAIYKNVKIKGDLNNDKLVNADDAAVALDLYKYGNATPEDMEVGDLDEDGSINADDAALILDIYKYGK